jgi:hypothetical protein
MTDSEWMRWNDMAVDTTRPRRLSGAERAGLIAALDDEYEAHATYAQVIEDFGDVRPFTNIIGAEARHADALVKLFHRYGVPVPANTWPGRVPRYETLQQACEAAVAAEIDNGELYDRLLAGTARSDVLAVYRNLQAASQERHLVAFRRCAGGDQPGHEAHQHGHRHPHQRRRRRRHRGVD